MKTIRKIFLMLFLFTLVNTAFAELLIPFNIVNNLPQTANIGFWSQWGFPGLAVAPNGGSMFVRYAIKEDRLEIPLAIISSDFNQSFASYPCYSADGNYSIVLNPKIYNRKKHDTITITYVSSTNNGMICTCSGSACDVSLAMKPKVLHSPGGAPLSV